MELNWKLISDLVGFAASLIAILGAMIVVVKWMKSHKDGMSYFLNYSRHNFFYPRTLANRILKENLMKPLGDSKFIDYGSAISKGFYSEDVAEMEVLCNDGKKTISIPYKVEINYIERPNAKIVIKNRNLHDVLQLSETHKKETEPLLQAFLETKKNTTDDRTLRIKSIEQVTENVYECDLQLASYYDQVRTNLTIDMPLGVGRTMRLEDLSGTKQLKKLSESILANTIGVSAIWIMPYKKGDKILFPMATGRRVEEQTLIYRGKKNFKAENDVNYRCLVFSLVEYDKKGKEKEVITFYVTDDKNHLPVRLDLYLNFGSAKAFLKTVEGNRHPLTSIIK